MQIFIKIILNVFDLLIALLRIPIVWPLKLLSLGIDWLCLSVDALFSWAHDSIGLVHLDADRPALKRFEMRCSNCRKIGEPICDCVNYDKWEEAK